MRDLTRFLAEHEELTRRYFLKIGAGGLVAGGLWSRAAAEQTSPELAEAICACIEPEPKDRCPSMAEFIKRIRNVQQPQKKVQ